MESDPDGAREVRVPGVRDHHPTTGTVPSDRPGPCGTEPAGDDPGREIRYHQPLNRQSEMYAARASTSTSRRSRTGWGPAQRYSPAGGADPGMCWRPSGFMAMTRRCRCWRKARQSPAGCGRMFVTTDPMVERCLRPPYFTSRVTDEASILVAPHGIWRHPAGRCLRWLRPLVLRSEKACCADFRLWCWRTWQAQLFQAGSARKGAARDRGGRRIDAIFDLERTINGQPRGTAAGYTAG